MLFNTFSIKFKLSQWNTTKQSNSWVDHCSSHGVVTEMTYVWPQRARCANLITSQHAPGAKVSFCVRGQHAVFQSGGRTLTCRSPGGPCSSQEFEQLKLQLQHKGSRTRTNIDPKSQHGENRPTNAQVTNRRRPDKEQMGLRRPDLWPSQLGAAEHRGDGNSILTDRICVSTPTLSRLQRQPTHKTTGACCLDGQEHDCILFNWT